MKRHLIVSVARCADVWHQPIGSGSGGRVPNKSYIDRAAHERAAALRLLDDAEEVRVVPAQVVGLGDASGEVLQALNGGSSRQRLVAAVQPAGTTHTPVTPAHERRLMKEDEEDQKRKWRRKTGRRMYFF